jgi:hypothetical protein
MESGHLAGAMQPIYLGTGFASANGFNFENVSQVMQIEGNGPLVHINCF